MSVCDDFKNLGITQTLLAKIISGAQVIEPKIKVRAHRIWHGAKPNDAEMQRIFAATNGAVTANNFYELPRKSKSHKRRTN